MKRRKNKDKGDYFDIDEFDVEIDPDDPVYPLNVVCRLLEMNYWTIHDILEQGIIAYKKKRESKKNKLLSYHDVKRLKYIKYLIEDKGVNIKGIKVIFKINGEI